MTSGLWAVALILAVLAVFAAALAVDCRQQGDVDRPLSAAALVARADAQQHVEFPPLREERFTGPMVFEWGSDGKVRTYRPGNAPRTNKRRPR